MVSSVLFIAFLAQMVQIGLIYIVRVLVNVGMVNIWLMILVNLFLRNVWDLLHGMVVIVLQGINVLQEPINWMDNANLYSIVEMATYGI